MGPSTAAGVVYIVHIVPLPFPLSTGAVLVSAWKRTQDGRYVRLQLPVLPWNADFLRVAEADLTKGSHAHPSDPTAT